MNPPPIVYSKPCKYEPGRTELVFFRLPGEDPVTLMRWNGNYIVNRAVWLRGNSQLALRSALPPWQVQNGHPHQQPWRFQRHHRVRSVQGGHHSASPFERSSCKTRGKACANSPSPAPSICLCWSAAAGESTTRLKHGLHRADFGSRLAVVAGRAVLVVDRLQGFAFILIFADQIAC